LKWIARKMAGSCHVGGLEARFKSGEKFKA